MQAFLLDDSVRSNIGRLIEHAETHPFSIEDLLKKSYPERHLEGSMKDFTIFIPHSYRVVYTVELQKCKVKHLSITLQVPGKLPSVPIVDEILKLFKFKDGLASGELIVTMEKDFLQDYISVIELVK